MRRTRPGSLCALHLQSLRCHLPQPFYALLALLFHDDCLVALLAGTFEGANTASLAIVVIKLGPLAVLYLHGHIGTINPAKQALYTVFRDPFRLEGAP